ncbi:MAG TPA: hypothetical protein DIT13_04970 [Verrucomicrobiales bacterium]|nr:hypothetical protein [Verrucomicrobiales bacterium]HRJ09305.1 hypothetical protein [Prosthecobacter sp.]HRK15586.1 hypothetical protein [Prosthecobacter sp.]
MSEEITTELGFAVSVAETEEARGRWPDLTRLEQRRPDILGAIVWFLARGVSVKTITRALKVSPCTVNRVRHDPKWKVAVVSESNGVVQKLDEILALTVDEVLAQAREGNLPSIFDLKLLFDIRQLLSGGVTQRVEVKISADEEEFARFLAQARALPSPPNGMVFDAEFLPQSRDVTPAETPDRANTKEGQTDLESVSNGQ